MADERIVNAVKIVDPTTTSQQAAVDASGFLQIDIAAASVALDVSGGSAFTPGTTAGNLGKAEDGPSAGGDTLVGVAAVQDAALGALTSIDGDYTWLRTDANGALWVIPSGTVVVDLGANNDVTTELAGSTAVATMADNDANPDVLPVGAYLMAFDGATWDRVRGTSTTGIEVDIVQSVTLDTELPAAAALADDAANPTVPGVGGFMMGYDSGNTNWNRVEVDDAGHLQVDVLTGGGTDTPTNPVVVVANTTDTAAGSTSGTTIQTADLGGTTKSLSRATASASVAFKAELQTVDDGTPTTWEVQFGRAGTSVVFTPPHRDYWTDTWAANAGFDGFRLVVTNLDTSEAADLHGSFNYED
jgi:hypothetical protein